MDDITITGMNLVRNPKPWSNGDTLLAHFDVEFSGIAIAGCLLIKTAKRGFVAQMPKVDDQRGNRRPISITDNSLRHKIMDAGRTAYIAFGGEGGEWTRYTSKAE
ncbi:hypothetical protein JT55_10260 [Rhodovulum sp. NI22]|nr:hypothetical protein JT55_10260 [Rhodovulum sp. NI22]